MGECKHKKVGRLYVREKSWTSTNLYKCFDCGDIIKKEFGDVSVTEISVGGNNE